SPPGKYTGIVKLNYQNKSIVAKKDFDFYAEKGTAASADNTSGALKVAVSESPQPSSRPVSVESPLPEAPHSEAPHSETPVPAVTHTHSKPHAKAAKHTLLPKTSQPAQAMAVHKAAAPISASSASSASSVKEPPQPAVSDAPTPASASATAVSTTAQPASAPAVNIEASKGITGDDSNSLWVLLIISIGSNVILVLILLVRQKNYRNDFELMAAKAELQSQSLKNVEDGVGELKQRMDSMNYDGMKASIGTVTGKLVVIEDQVAETAAGVKSSLEALTEKTESILAEVSLDTNKEFRIHDEKVTQQFSQLNSRLNEIESLSASSGLRSYVDESVVPRFEALVREATESVSNKLDEGVKNRILTEIVSLKEGVIEIIRFLLATSK
ncbi:MAG: hypothetical protein HQK89_02280, partial [Nitrospirae bacterium]|nr:hypothetical protein [Nitrospirota bacterium]